MVEDQGTTANLKNTFFKAEDIGSIMVEGQGTTANPFKLGIEINKAAGVKALEGLTLGSADLAAFISPGVESAIRMTTGIDPMEALQNQALAQDLTKLTGVKISDFADRLRDITATSIGFGLMGGSVGGVAGAAVGATAGALTGAIRKNPELEKVLRKIGINNKETWDKILDGFCVLGAGRVS